MESSDQFEHTIEFELSEECWDELADCLEKFSDAWEACLANSQAPKNTHSASSSSIDDSTIDAPPTIDNLNQKIRPPCPGKFLDGTQESLRPVSLAELIKLDLEYRSRHVELWKPLEGYLKDWPELSVDGELPCDLVFEEYQIRKRLPELPTAAEYQERFPKAFSQLTRLIKDETRETSALFKPGQAISYNVGDKVDDFDLLTRLGKGAFATVFLARQNSMQRIVALKISADQGHEPQMLAQLDHPHIVRVYDQRVIEEPSRARLMYMQHIAGGTLQEVLKEVRQVSEGQELHGRHLVAAVDRLLNMRGESIPVKSENRRRLANSTWAQVVSQIGNEIAQALAYAHDRNVLHRDLKPANVLLDKDCHVKLVDFNISFSSKIDGATPAAYFGGSLAYMSPEQLEACSPDHDLQPDALDGRSDLYTVGVLLYELLVGSRPFADSMIPGDWSGSMAKMIRERRAGLNEEACEKLKHHPQILASSITRCLGGRQTERFADATGLARSLEMARNPNSEELFRPRSSLIGRFVNWAPFNTTGMLTIGISLAAIQFIKSYNFGKAVPMKAMNFFKDLTNYQNAILIPMGALILFLLTRPVSRCLKMRKQGKEISAEQVNHAIERNLKLSHYIAIMCVVEWTIGGFILPAVLSIYYPMSSKAIFDFLSSHFLAGCIAGAYVFWAVTYCVLYCWQPRLLAISMESDGRLDWSREHTWLQNLFDYYHFLAISIPLIAIAWLILAEKMEDQRSLSILSIVAVLGLIALAWASQRVRFWMDVHRSFDPKVEEF